jgi:hypothetical protein
MYNLRIVIVTLCALMLLVFAFSFWIAAQKAPAQGGPSLDSGR